MNEKCNEFGTPDKTPTHRRTKPKLTPGDKFMPPEDVQRLLAVAKAAVDQERTSRRRRAKRAERNYLILAVGLNAGLRASELADLRVHHLRLDDNPPRILVEGGKGRKAGAADRLTHDVDEVAISFDLAILLRAWVNDPDLDPSDPVFWSERKTADGGKQPLTRHGVWNAIKGLIRAAGLNDLYSTHTLRHRFVTAEVEAQELRGIAVNPYFIARRARHRSLESAMVYVHQRKSELDEHMKVRRSEL